MSGIVVFTKCSIYSSHFPAPLKLCLGDYFTSDQSIEKLACDLPMKSSFTEAIAEGILSSRSSNFKMMEPPSL